MTWIRDIATYSWLKAREITATLKSSTPIIVNERALHTTLPLIYQVMAHVM